MEKQKTQNRQINPEKHMYVFFGEMFIPTLCPFKKSGCFLLLSCMGSLYILDTNSSSDTWFAHNFSHSNTVAFSLSCFLCCREAFNFDVVPLVYFCFCYLCFWCPFQEMSNVTKFFHYVLF